MKQYFFFFLFFFFLISSCKKEQIEILTQEIHSHTSHSLTDIFFVNDSIGYACGGNKYTIGLLLKTFDGGQTWNQPDSIIPKVANAQYFFNATEGFVAGYDTWLAQTVDSAKTFSASPSYNWETQDIYFGDREHGVRVNGSGYNEGKIMSTADGGASWAIVATLPNSLHCVTYSDHNTAFVGGYGVIYKSTDAGQTFYPLDVQGDFFVATDFPSASVGYFAGYQGMILKTIDAGNSFSKVMRENIAFAKREHFEALDFWDESNGFVVGDAGVMYQTTDGGENWKKIKPFTELNLRDIHLFSATSGIVVGDEGKVFLFRN
ncbi:MAG: YCF48-related protein [Bacteroidota bacterium]